MLRIRIIFLYCACVLLTGCGKINDVKTDSVNNYSYKIEDLVTFPVNDSNSYVDVLEDMIVYNDSRQRIVLTNNIGKSEKELFNVDSNKSICSFGIDSNDNLLIITKGEDSTDSQYEWIEINENEELVGTGNIDGVTYPLNVAKKDNENRLFVLSWDGEIYLYNKEGEFERKIELDGYADSIDIDIDGKLIIGEMIDDSYYAIRLDDNLKNVESKKLLNNEGLTVKILLGKDGNCYYYGEDYLYSFDLNKNVTTPILRWVDEGIDKNAIHNIAISKNGSIILSLEEDDKYVIKKLSSINKKQENKKELVLACVGLNSVMRAQILGYNNDSSEYKISICDYTDEEDPYQAMNLDIMAGKKFDIICLDGLYTQNYIKIGLLEDLSKYVDKNEYVQSYIQAIQSENAIYQVSPYFSVQTIIGKTDDVGADNCWTSDEMIDFFEDNIKTRGILFYDESDLLRTFLWSGMDCFFINKEQDYYFESDMFSRTLKFIGDYQMYAMKNDKEVDIPSTDMLYGGELLLLKGSLSSGDDYRMYKTMFNSEITAKGYPNNKNSGNYMELGMPIAICSKSNHKEEAWRFISDFFEDDVQYEMKEYGFPVKQNVLERLYDEWCNDDNDLSLTIGGKEKKIPQMNKDDVNELDKIINSSNQLRAYDRELINIIQEESMLYFQKQQKIEDTIMHIKKRVNTYIEEKK